MIAKTLKYSVVLTLFKGMIFSKAILLFECMVITQSSYTDLVLFSLYVNTRYHLYL